MACYFETWIDVMRFCKCSCLSIRSCTDQVHIFLNLEQVFSPIASNLETFIQLDDFH